MNGRDDWGLLSDWSVFWKLYDHWTLGKGHPFIRRGGAMANYFKDYPGFKRAAHAYLLKVAKSACQGNRTEGIYKTPTELMLINRSWPVTMSLNGVNYSIYGKYIKKSRCEVELQENKHVVTDIADPDGIKDFPFWISSAIWQAITFGSDEAPLVPFKVEISWYISKYKFKAKGGKCTFDEVTGNWPFN